MVPIGDDDRGIELVIVALDLEDLGCVLRDGHWVSRVSGIPFRLRGVEFKGCPDPEAELIVGFQVWALDTDPSRPHWPVGAHDSVPGAGYL